MPRCTDPANYQYCYLFSFDIDRAARPLQEMEKGTNRVGVVVAVRGQLLALDPSAEAASSCRVPLLLVRLRQCTKL